MPALFPAGFSLDVRTASAEDLEAASTGWDVRYAQLGSGRADCRRVAVHSAHLQLCFEAWSLGMLKSGRAPRGAVTFLVVAGRSGSARVQGRQSPAGAVFVLFEEDDLDCRTAGPAQFVSVSIERAALDRHLHELFGWDHGELRLRGRFNALRTDPPSLRTLCLDVAARAAAEPGFLRDPAVTTGLERRIVKLLWSETAAPAEAAAASRGRALALRAEAWLRQNLAEPPPIAVLCEELGVRERTLHDAFRDHLDTTPKAYLKALRLNAAHHDLRRGTVKTRVTDVALDWGFGHFGWFSQDYRRLFGETPSQTLQRSRGHAGRGLPRAPLAVGA
jgi:AraC family ethanolamine operon transcriptional activator